MAALHCVRSARLARKLISNCVLPSANARGGAKLLRQ
jgi:hypothetical protein